MTDPTDIHGSPRILLIGGASGTGKSSLAYLLGTHYRMNVLEIDDIFLTVKEASTAVDFPAVHGRDTGCSSAVFSMEEDLEWLSAVSRELTPVLRKLIERHLEDGVDAIIEGDFLDPLLCASLSGPRVESIFVAETDPIQIARNYLCREGGELQTSRAEVSAAYELRLLEKCRQLGLKTLPARPWDTLLDRAVKLLG